jgi:membrane protein DedA with SNARE-associated domain
MDLDGLFSRYGYLVLLLGRLADGTPVMLFGGFAAHRGWLVLVPYVILAGAVGNFLAGGAWFFATRALGDKVLARRPRWAREVAKVQPRLERWEAPVILGVRFLPGLATAGLIAVALSGILPARFLLLNAVRLAVGGDPRRPWLPPGPRRRVAAGRDRDVRARISQMLRLAADPLG